MNTVTPLTPYRTVVGDKLMLQRSVGSLIRSVAAIMLVAIMVSAIAMVLAESIAEVNRQFSTAANGGLFDLIAAIVLTMLNVIAAGAGSAVTGALIGLAVGAAISIVYL